MIDQTGRQAARAARRRSLSRVRRDRASAYRGLRRGIARVGVHGLVVAVGLSVAVSGWQGPRGPLGQEPSLEAVVEELFEEAPTLVSEMVASLPAGEPLKPLLHKIAEGDTIRAIAAEYSVSIDTILASNEIDDPDMIMPGQELMIPPVEGVVAAVEPGETVAQLAARLGVDPGEILRVNALPDAPDQTIPYERLVVPGIEPAERVAAPKRKRPIGPPGTTRPDAPAATEGEAVAGGPRPTQVTYEVQEGDTVVQLSGQFGVSIWTILTANSMSDPNMLKPGTQLKVPPVNGVEHEVQPGESLVDIAKYYEIDLGPLIDFNEVADPNSLQIGSRLLIPGADKIQPGFSLATIAPSAPVAAPAVIQPSASASRPAAASSAPAAAARPPAQAAAQAAPSQPAASQAQAGRPAAAQTAQAPAAQAARPAAQTAQSQTAQSRPAAAQAVPSQTAPAAQAAPKPQAPAAAQAQPAAKPQGSAAATAQAKPELANRLAAASIGGPIGTSSSGGAGGGTLVSSAMRYLGSRYVFGGTSPSGFDCSGFVWYVHNAMGKPISRGLWGQMNGGPRIARDALLPGDTVFFANTYMPGLSHVGIYIGGGRFVHASDERTGVTISSLSDSYWGPRYVGASRLW